MNRIRTFSIWILYEFMCCALVTARIKECGVSEMSTDYMGTIQTTVNGLTCQRWDSQFPHTHTWTRQEYFPDPSMEDVANNCRNPDKHAGGSWCYTTDPDTRWEYCAIPRCPDFPECRWTDAGSEYRGTQNVSNSGVDCVNWDRVPTALSLGPDARIELKDNYCRNPDSKSAGPWCYVSEAGSWQHCDVPFCKVSSNCRTTWSGRTYVGKKSLTASGRMCQRWDRQAPHQHTDTDPGNFPDASLADADNFCRNPDNSADGPWCYTTDPEVRREYCDLPMCEECKHNGEGRDYGGNRTQTVTGKSCQAWSSQAPHVHAFTDPDRFPDATIADASNYCRNPDGKPEGPWCLTADPGTVWEYCDVPVCDGSCQNEYPRQPRAKHIVHIGVDGLKPTCFLDAPSGAPNFRRLMSEGAWTTTQGRTVAFTWSAPCWTTILSGMPSESHGILDNSWLAPWRGNVEPITPIQGNSTPFPMGYAVLKAYDSNIRTAFFHSWYWFDEIASYGIPGSLDKEFYCDGYFPAERWEECDTYVATNASAYLADILKGASPTSYTFVYLTFVDVEGHANGWCSPEYLSAVDVNDALLGQLLDTIDQSGAADDVMVVVNTDHGGLGFGHGRQADYDLLIPMFMRGPGIKPNYQFQHEANNVDVVPTIFHVLGIEPSPFWSGEIKKEIFEL